MSDKGFSRLPRGIWALGFVSLFMDVSSELTHSLLPVFMVSVLGASLTTVGVIEGFAEAAAAITKVFSGTVSDYLGKRKLLALLGYVLGAATKPVFPLAGSIGWVFGARFVDRVGKGIRGAPRDALVADLTPLPLRGTAYGLRQALDSVGAFFGPLLAVLFMAWFADNIRTVLWVAVAPACLSVVLLAAGVKDLERPADAPAARRSFNLAGVGDLPLRYWLIVLLGTIFTLARFSEAFLVLRAQSAGMALGAIPVVMIVMNVVYAGTAYPAGILADRMRASSLLSIGLALLITADILLAFAGSPFLTLVGSALWGMHLGFTQGLFAKLVADIAPQAVRGTAFGIFNLVSGLALLLSSVIAGLLWSACGPAGTFLAGACFAALALAGLTVQRLRA